MRALEALREERRANGAPLPTKRVLALLDRIPPKDFHPFRKRFWLQSRKLIVALGDGTWDIPQR